jgi:hypothetical protein
MAADTQTALVRGIDAVVNQHETATKRDHEMLAQVVDRSEAVIKLLRVANDSISAD